jgi:hypothetical protein
MQLIVISVVQEIRDSYFQNVCLYRTVTAPVVMEKKTTGYFLKALTPKRD